jgi:hypothetical protein
MSTYTIAPSDGKINTYLPKTIKNSDFIFTFRARCTQGLHLVFSKAATDTSADAYAIVIGGMNNTASWISYGTGEASLGPKRIQAYLCNSDNLQPFWVSYKNGKLRVGGGKYHELPLAASATATEHAAINSAVATDGYFDIADADVPPIPGTDLYVGFASTVDSMLVKVNNAPVVSSDGWSDCSAKCDVGTQERKRIVVTQPLNGGKECPALKETRDCTNTDCSSKCKSLVGAWSAFGPCSAECGDGTQVRTRTITPNPYSECPTAVSETRKCKDKECPIHCKTTAWGILGDCDATCGMGHRRKTRTVTVEPKYDGDKCGPLVYEEECDAGRCTCKEDIEQWSPCSVKCGGGGKKTRKHKFTPVGAVTSCPVDYVEESACGEECCPVDCVMSEWSGYSACTSSCGVGTQEQTRTIKTQPSCGGAACPLERTQSQLCNTKPCAPTCPTGAFGEWSQCTKKCTDSRGSGKQYRLMKIGQVDKMSIVAQAQCDDNMDANLGAVTVGNSTYALTDANSINVFYYNANGELTVSRGPIAQDSNALLLAAASTSGEGVQIVVVHYGSKDGMGAVSQRNLDALATLGSVALVVPSCPSEKQAVAAEQSTGWSYIFVRAHGVTLVDKLANGCDTQRFAGDVQTKLAAAVADCPRWSRQEQACSQQACPINCKVSEWGDYSTCLGSCGGGTKKHTRTVIRAASADGKQCPSLEETTECNPEECDPCCNTGKWTGFNLCDKTCGGAFSTGVSTPRAVDQM